jgi:hypothetical protein
MSTNDGGPAFPSGDMKTGDYCEGMSLRDWFAGQAHEAQSIVNRMSVEEINAILNLPSGCRLTAAVLVAAVAKVRVEIADAMLVELDKEK